MTKAMKSKWIQFGVWVALSLIGGALYWYGVDPGQVVEATGNQERISTALIIDENYTCTETALVLDYTPTDLCFGGGSRGEVMFEWNDGKLNVVYDPNEVEQSAVTFFNVMLPYLNDNIEAEINRRTE